MTNQTIEKKILDANDVAAIFGVSKSKAYKIISELNEKLKRMGKITVAGRISRKYFEESSFI